MSPEFPGIPEFMKWPISLRRLKDKSVDLQRRSKMATADDQFSTEGMELKLTGVTLPPAAIHSAAGAVSPGPLDGAFLVIQHAAASNSHVWGCAALVAPGISVTAKHVVEAITASCSDLDAQIQVSAISLKGDSLEIWNVENILIQDIHDLAILEMKPAEDNYSSLDLRMFKTTTKMPEVGESLALVGFVASDERFPIEGDEHLAAGKYHVSVGNVTATYPTGRDSVMLPFPCVEVAVDTFKGMSGGPVFNSMGHLVGVITSGFEGEGQGPTFVSMLWHALTMPNAPKWPPNLHAAQGRLLDSRYAFIEDRWRIQLVDGGPSFTYNSA